MSASVNHPAHRMLHNYRRHGVPVTLADSPWTASELQDSLERGPHKSAYEYIEFLREDMADMVAKGFWVVVTYDSVKHVKGLRLSPIGVVPQRARRPRPIVDYSFYGVNQATQPNVPTDAMQFGRALERLLRKVLLASPRHGKVYLMKIDLADGFYRVPLSAAGLSQLGVVFPHLPHEQPLVALPIGLPMGWSNSPPGFCTATETVADVTSCQLLQGRLAPDHPLESLASSRPPRRQQPTNTRRVEVAQATPVPTRPDPHLNPQRRRRLQYVDVYMDDFLGAAQGNKAARNNVRRTTMHAIDDMFRPTDHLDAPTRKQPISVKKLSQGDASWSTQKEVLGWLIDTEAMTLQLTPRRQKRLYELLYKDLPKARKRITVQDWHKVLGELRSMSLALPGSRGLFSQLQHALSTATPDSRIRLTEPIHQVLDNFRALYTTLQQRPTRIQELVPLTPTVDGCHDAAGHGAGGVLIPTPQATARQVQLKTLPSGRHTIVQQRPGPIVWRMPFPKTVTNSLITFDNPRGSITNTDLELAGSLLQSEAAVQCFDLRERTHLQRTDNMGTVPCTGNARGQPRRSRPHLRYFAIKPSINVSTV